MTDHEKRIREALEAGPTEGEWLTDKRDPRFVYALNVEGYNQFWAHVHGHNTRTVELEANAHLIAACNPTALRALLADLDEARSALTAAKAGGWVAVQDCPDGDVWFALSCGHLVMGHKTGSMLAWDDEHSCCWSAEAIKAQPLTAPTLPKEQSA